MARLRVRRIPRYGSAEYRALWLVHDLETMNLYGCYDGCTSHAKLIARSFDDVLDYLRSEVV